MARTILLQGSNYSSEICIINKLVVLNKIFKMLCVWDLKSISLNKIVKTWNIIIKGASVVQTFKAI